MKNILSHLIFTLLLAAMCAPSAAARKRRDDDNRDADTASIVLPGVRRPVVREHYCAVNDEGDSVMYVILNPVTVLPELKFKNKKEEQFYWRTVRDVKRALPYAKLISETLVETYEYIETFPTTKEREDYLKAMEDDIFNRYKPYLRRFTRNQARILCKLIQRETHQSGYSIIKAFMGTFRAMFWQGFGRMFGVNLKGDYRPATDRTDAMIERICIRIEEGSL